ncbi:MAG: hypothetical protein ACRDZ3_19635 [Acidimicrobiia bacterium]
MKWWRRRSGPDPAAGRFREDFERNLAGCDWAPHPRWSVFTQYDGDVYRAEEEAFEHKYRCFWALSRTVAPVTMIELGVAAGAGADAYLSGCPQAGYLGVDTFGEPFTDGDGSPWRSLAVDDQTPWKPYDIATALLADRDFSHARLLVANLRHLDALPERADLVVVDAAHDYENEYADLRLALTADPAFIFVDDAEGAETAMAIKEFVERDLGGRPEWTVPIDYIGGGLVIKVAQGRRRPGS